MSRKSVHIVMSSLWVLLCLEDLIDNAFNVRANLILHMSHVERQVAKHNFVNPLGVELNLVSGL